MAAYDEAACPGSPALIAVIRGFFALHELDFLGFNDSPEADAVRDAMEAPSDILRKQFPAEREIAHQFSADLGRAVDAAKAAAGGAAKSVG